MPYSVSPFLREKMRRPEADHVLRHADTEQLGRGEVAELVPGDGEQQADDEDDYAEDGHPGRHARASEGVRAARAASSRARARAQVSASRTSATRQGGSPGGRAVFGDHCGDGIHDPGERQPALEERVDALLVRRVEDGGGGAAQITDLAGQRDGGEGVLVQREELPGLRLRPVEARRGVRDPLGPAECPARSASACRAGWPGRAWSRR